MQSEDCRLSPSSEERVKLIYKGFVRSKGGPYMKAVYCLLARCDVSNNHPEVCVKTEDYMWLKVNFITLHIYCIAGNFFLHGSLPLQLPNWNLPILRTCVYTCTCSDPLPNCQIYDNFAVAIWSPIAKFNISSYTVVANFMGYEKQCSCVYMYVACSIIMWLYCYWCVCVCVCV